MVSLKHEFQSGKADGTDVTLVKPTNWNAEHKFETAADGVVLGRAAGASPGAVQELPITSLMPAGMIMPYAGSAAPTGWLLCQGQLLLRADYAALFAIIGSTYGSADAARFNLPDLRGRVVAGVDAGAGRIGAAVGGGLGNAGGQEMVQYYADVNVHGGNRAYGASYGGGLAVHVEMDTWQTDGWGGASGGGPLVGSHSHHMAGDFAVGGTIATYVDISLPSAGGGYTRNGSNTQPTIVLHYLIKT